ncbi:MAG: hypothetical protein MI923_13970 [Phycisphaerales bacterium]|nr:hypothetical protein [Phycisphaerales bacterium]
MIRRRIMTAESLVADTHERQAEAPIVKRKVGRAPPAVAGRAHKDGDTHCHSRLGSHAKSTDGMPKRNTGMHKLRHEHGRASLGHATPLPWELHQVSSPTRGHG